MPYLRDLGRALFARTAAAVKASAVGPLISRVYVGQPVWPRRDYEKLGREGYQQNPVVSRAVDLIADGVASVTLELQQGRGKRVKVLEEHPLLELLRHPNPEQDGQTLIKQLISHLIISGNGYVERTNEDKIQRMELYAHRPDRMRAIPGPQGWIEGFEYRAGGGTRRWDIDPDSGLRPILHMKRFHPTDDFYGMSPLDPAAWAIDIHNSASAFNKALLDNSAVPSGAYVYSPTEKGAANVMTAEQYDRLKSQLEEQHQGAKNAGKPMLLEGGLDWKASGLDLDALQFVDAKNMAAREIAFALGVPPMMLGIPGDNTYSNYAEANKAFYRQTVIPLAEWLARSLTHWFAEQLEDGMRLVVDLDTIEALAIERKEMWTSISATQYLSINEKREALGYKPVKGGEDIYIGAGLLPIGEEAAIAGGPEPTDGDEDDDEGKKPPGKQKPGSGSKPGEKRKLRVV